jgi:hypothetical protein
MNVSHERCRKSGIFIDSVEIRLTLSLFFHPTLNLLPAGCHVCVVSFYLKFWNSNSWVLEVEQQIFDCWCVDGYFH